MKRAGKIAVGFIAFFVIATAVLTIVMPARKSATYEKAYQALTKDMIKGDVVDLMGKPTRSKSDPIEYWDEELLKEDEIALIAETLEYEVSTFFLPIVFKLSFDSSGRLVGKHRY